MPAIGVMGANPCLRMRNQLASRTARMVNSLVSRQLGISTMNETCRPVAFLQILLLLFAAEPTIVAGGSKSKPHFKTLATVVRHGHGYRQLQRGKEGALDDSAVVEPGNCIPFEVLPSNVISHTETDEECKQNSCNRGCCRIFHWLLCDESNDFSQLQCACNANTNHSGVTNNSPTVSPSRLPPVTIPLNLTNIPSRSPTRAPITPPAPRPTATPFAPLTGAPTHTPSLKPSYRPTSTVSSLERSTIPSEIPSGAPSNILSKVSSSGPSRTPSHWATIVPSDTPSTMPSNNPSNHLSTPLESPAPLPFMTEVITNAFGDTVRLSKCGSLPPSLQLVEKETLRYYYEVFASSLNGTSFQYLVDQYLNDRIHDALAYKFLKCRYESDDLWLIQSTPHLVDETKACKGSTSQGQACFVVSGQDDLWLYNHPERRRRLQAIKYSKEIRKYLSNAMRDGLFSDPKIGIDQLLLVPYATQWTVSPTGSPTEWVGNSSTGNEGSSNGQNIDELSEKQGSTKLIWGRSVLILVIVLCGAVVTVVLVLLIIVIKIRRQVVQGKTNPSATFDAMDDIALEEQSELESSSEAVLTNKPLADLDSTSATSQSRMQSILEHDTLDDDVRIHLPTPLYPVDELDTALDERYQGLKGNLRNYETSDTVDL